MGDKVWRQEAEQVGTHLRVKRKKPYREMWWIAQLPSGKLVMTKKKPKSKRYIDGPLTRSEAEMRLGKDK